MKKHQRHSIRLKEYDYSQPGAYFITFCTYKHQCIFGNISNGEMILNQFGQIAEKEILKTEAIRSNFQIDKYAIMPNHIHLIIVISGTCTVHRAPTTENFGKPTKNSIPTIIRYIKSAITRQINLIKNTPGQSVWQRNYYEHIIRTETSLNYIRRYIINNPAKWSYDRHHHNDLSIDEKQKFWSRFLNEFPD